MHAKRGALKPQRSMSTPQAGENDATEPLLSMPQPDAGPSSFGGPQEPSASGESTPLMIDRYDTSHRSDLDHALHRLHTDRARFSSQNELGEENGGYEEDPSDGVNSGVDDEDIVVPGEETATRFVWILVGSAAISGLLFGYDTGVISGMLISIGTDLGNTLTDWQKELITSATTFGALLGGLAAGTLSDYTGRKPVIGLSNAVFIIGALLQAAAHSVSTMVWGRFVVGLGVGLASCIIPLYIGELAPTKIRGRLVVINNVAITLGQLVAYGIGATFQYAPGGWRWMVGLGALPSIVQLLALTRLPESPRILLMKSRHAEAQEVLSKVYPQASEHEIEAKVRVMASAVKQSAAITQRTPWLERLQSLYRVGANRRALIIGCGLQAAQQLCGFNTLMYYSATIFAALGFKNATLVGCLIAGVNFAFTLVALRIVDPLGRRTTMLYTLPVMVVALILSSIFFHRLTISTGGILVNGAEYSSTYAALIVMSMLLYVAGYATGLGNIPWQQGELFRLDVRGVGTSICTATNWTCNMIVAATFLTLMRILSPAGAFGLYAVFCVSAWVFCHRLYPETSGLSLEEVYHLFEEDFGVAKSREMKRTKRPQHLGMVR